MSKDSHIIKGSEWASAAGKGPEPRPVHIPTFKANLGAIKFSGKHAGRIEKKKGAKTTYCY